MGRINAGRVILGGLLAGLVWNVGEYVLNEPILGDDWAAAYEAIGLSTPDSPTAIALFVGSTFVMGILAVWLYAAIRPRFGPGPKTAIIAGLFLWLVVYGLFWFWNYISGIFPQRIFTVTLIWGFFEVPIATLVGAWIYREEPAAATPTVEARA